MKLFEMTTEEFENWMDSSEGQKFIDNFVNYLDEQMQSDPFFCAKQCWKWDCEHNSHYQKDTDVPLGSYTVCHKFKNDEKNNCSEREVWWLDE